MCNIRRASSGSTASPAFAARRGGFIGVDEASGSIAERSIELKSVVEQNVTAVSDDQGVVRYARRSAGHAWCNGRFTEWRLGSWVLGGRGELTGAGVAKRRRR